MAVHRKPGSQLLPALGILVTAAAVGFGVVAGAGIGPSYSELRARISSQNAVPACPPLVFFGIRGSGETAKDYYGYGKIILSMRNDLQDLVPGMGSEPVSYPATAVRWPDPRYKMAYGRSVSHGVAAVMAIYATLRSWCPRTPLVLAGYGQGADVAYRVSSLLPEAARSRVIIATFGDPHFNPAQSWADAGTRDAAFWAYRTWKKLS